MECTCRPFRGNGCSCACQSPCTCGISLPPPPPDFFHDVAAMAASDSATFFSRSVGPVSPAAAITAFSTSRPMLGTGAGNCQCRQTQNACGTRRLRKQLARGVAAHVGIDKLEKLDDGAKQQILHVARFARHARVHRCRRRRQFHRPWRAVANERRQLCSCASVALWRSDRLAARRLVAPQSCRRPTSTQAVGLHPFLAFH
jgi:hypothetical protein